MRGNRHLPGCQLAQPGEAQPGLQTLVVALQAFAIDQHGQTILEAEMRAVRLASLFLECVGHADEAEFAQAVDGWDGSASRPPQW